MEIAEIGRLLTLACYVPDAGSGDYDLLPIANELKAKYPQYADYFSQVPRDPSRGTNSESFYRYIVDEATKKCSIYANLENSGEKVTIPGVSVPTAGGGVGVWQAGSPGWNGTDKYFQYGN